MLYRDDDVNCYTDLGTFIKIHGLFIKHNKIHTCAVEMKDLWESKGIWYLLATLPNIEIGLHGWEHKDYSKLSCDEISIDIGKSIKYWRSHLLEGFGKIVPLTTFYPPWNRVSPNLLKACEEWGLKIDNRTNDPEVFGFHWWEFIDGHDIVRLEKVLI